MQEPLRLADALVYWNRVPTFNFNVEMSSFTAFSLSFSGNDKQ